MRKKKALFLTCLLVVSFGLTALVALFADKQKETEGFLCVTSFYPVQLLAESVAEGAVGVEVLNLTENHGGCLHDYTITTKDMRLLSEADMLLINGGEMELFLEKVAKEFAELSIVDTSEGFRFLEGAAHHHGHEAEWHEQDAYVAENHGAEEHIDAEYEGESHDGHIHEVNAHLWLDIDGYLYQLARVEEAFVAADPAQAELYRKNAETCRRELLQLKEGYDEAKEQLEGKETVVFHEGFVYLFNMLGIETVHCIAMDGETQIAAGEAAEVIEECNLHGIDRMFAEEDYIETVKDTFATDFFGEIMVLDSLTGDDAGNASDGTNGILIYCERMKKNLDRIMQAYGVR